MKYDTAPTFVAFDQVDLQKRKCAMACASRNLFKFELWLGNEDEKICSLLEYQPHDYVSSIFGSKFLCFFFLLKWFCQICVID